MRKYVNEELELDVETITKLKEIAEQNNATIDEVINEILITYMSEKVGLDEFRTMSEETIRKGYYIIVDANDQAIAQVTPLN